MSERTYRVGVIGCGRKGTQHARAWHLTPGAEVVAAAETDPENAELFRKRFGVPVYDDYRRDAPKARASTSPRPSCP